MNQTTMTAFTNYPVTTEINTHGHMVVGGCDTIALAKEYGTPLYIFDEETLRSRCKQYIEAFQQTGLDFEVIYASKACSLLAVLQIIREEGLGIDIVSGGELYTALQAGFSGKQIYFHGNNKQKQEISEALDAEIGHFIVDNLDELENIDRLAKQKNVTANIMIRVTPGIEAHTHEYIQTGQLDSKFGIHADQIVNAVKLAQAKKNVNFVGLHIHIGSQILETKPFSLAAEIAMNLVKEIHQKTKATIKVLDLGGGLGINYLSKDKAPAIADYIKVLADSLKYVSKQIDIPIPKIMVEPGRSIVAPAGVTLYQVGTIKDLKNIRKYVAVDGGMADNPRPITYGAIYDAVVANKISDKRTEIVTIAGKYCESGDILVKDIQMQPIVQDDTIAFMATGAYNHAMSSNYNQALRPATVLVNNGQSKVICKRESYADLLKNQIPLK